MGKLTFGSTGLSYQVDKVSVGGVGGVGGAPTCGRCSTRVYFNEERRAIGKVWHIRCFTCVSCKKGLDSTTCTGHEGDIYCSPCHRRQFGPKGYGFAGGASGLSTETGPKRGVRSTATNPAPVKPQQVTTARDVTDTNNCPQCGARVYFAEEILALGRKWHRLCFKCCSCNKPLQPGNCNEHDSLIYCSSCYGRSYGPKGYGFAGGAGTLMSTDAYTNGHAHHNHVISNKTNDSESFATGGRHEWTEALYL